MKQPEKKVKKMHWPGIEPGPPAWQARILPLNHQCLWLCDSCFHPYIFDVSAPPLQDESETPSDIELRELKESLSDTPPVGALIKCARTLDQVGQHIHTNTCACTKHVMCALSVMSTIQRY